MLIKVVDRQLFEAKAKRRKVRAAIGSILRNARKPLFNRVEIEIQRYQAALVNLLNQSQRDLEQSVGASGHLAITLNDLVEEFQKLGMVYLQNGADIGYERALTDLKDRGWIASYQEPVHAPKEAVEAVLTANYKYLRLSLLPDLQKKLQWATPSNVGPAIAAMRARVQMYGHYVWVASQESYRACIKDFFTHTTLHESAVPRKIKIREGGPGSGFHGHAGRPGIRGGSAAGGGKAQAIFLMGGSASGKGRLAQRYAKEYGIKNVINCDHIKEAFPLFTGKPINGKYGTSGPKTYQELIENYTPEEVANVNEYIRDHTPFSDVHEFAQRQFGDPDKFYEDNNPASGGLTHEVSSYIAKQQLAGALDSGKSFVYDSTGNGSYYPIWAGKAADAGMAVTIAQAYVPREVAHMNDDARGANADPGDLTGRTVGSAVLMSTHDKVDAMAPVMAAWATGARAAGQDVTFTRDDTYTPEMLARARELGYTYSSRPTGN